MFFQNKQKILFATLLFNVLISLPVKSWADGWVELSFELVRHTIDNSTDPIQGSSEVICEGRVEIQVPSLAPTENSEQFLFGECETILQGKKQQVFIWGGEAIIPISFNSEEEPRPTRLFALALQIGDYFVQTYTGNFNTQPSDGFAILSTKSYGSVHNGAPFFESYRLLVQYKTKVER